MRRIVYALPGTEDPTTGPRMMLRQVEALRELGFDAVAYAVGADQLPGRCEHQAPVLVGAPVSPDRSVFVVPDTSVDMLRQLARLDCDVVVFCRGELAFATAALPALDGFPRARPPRFLAATQGIGALVRRAVPAAEVEMVEAFADERRFRPVGPRGHGVAYSSLYRDIEAAVVRGLVAALHPHLADLPWTDLAGLTETQAAAALAGSSLFLSLGDLAGPGLAGLEAMASGALCVGLRGAAEAGYATPENGLWVPSGEMEAAAEALARAAGLVASGGPELRRVLAAGAETAALRSYGPFRAQLEAAWTRLAPDTRVSSGPLD